MSINRHFIKLLIILHLAAIAACEVPTTVSIANPAIPPTFKLSGNGYLFHFIVVGPYSSEQELRRFNDKVQVVWQMSPDEHADDRVYSLPQITYGQVPSGFKQDEPVAGSPPVLEPGKFYSIGSPSLNADFSLFCFKVEPAAVVEVSCGTR